MMIWIRKKVLTIQWYCKSRIFAIYKWIKFNKVVMNINFDNYTTVENDTNVTIKYLKMLHFKMLQ